MRGDGRVYQVKGSRFWHISFPGQQLGEQVRESTEETTKNGALRVLRNRRSEAAMARTGKGTFERRDLYVEQLVLEAVRDLEARGKPSARAEKSRAKQIIRKLGGMRALAVKRATLQSYQIARQAEKASGKTINHELSLLSRAFILAMADGTVSRRPQTDSLEVNRRTVSIETADVYAILARVDSPDLRDWLEFFCVTGARDREISTLEWRDLADDLLTIRKENAKIRKARALPVVGLVAEIIERRKATRRPGCPFIFHRDGVSFDKKTTHGLPDWAMGAWHRATTPGLRPYDLRRHANNTLLEVGVDSEIRSMLVGQKPPGQNPNYLDFTKPPVTDRFAEALELASARIRKARVLPRKLSAVAAG
jgi:integrase